MDGQTERWDVDGGSLKKKNILTLESGQHALSISCNLRTSSLAADSSLAANTARYLLSASRFLHEQISQVASMRAHSALIGIPFAARKKSDIIETDSALEIVIAASAVKIASS